MILKETLTFITPEEAKRKLIDRLNRNPFPQISNIELLSSGMDCLVFSGNTEQKQKIAIKVPRNRFIENPIDGKVDTRLRLLQERMLSVFFSSFIPVPKIYDIYLGKDNFDYLATERIDYDDSKPSDFDLGRILFSIHSQELPDLFAGITKDSTMKLLAQRTKMRLEVLDRITQDRIFSVFTIQDIEEHFMWSGMSTNILHMDFRYANILTKNSMVKAIIDWGNVVVGDPLLELTRIDEFRFSGEKILTHEFLRGYGNLSPFECLPKTVEYFYRLYTATMMSILFILMFPNRKLAQTYLSRTRFLIEELT